MSSDEPHQQHSSECLTKVSSRHQDTLVGVLHLVSRESLLAMGFSSSDSDKSTFCSLTPNKSSTSLSSASEEATVALTDCSSRTSLQDLDNSFADEFKDPLPTPDLCYWKPVHDKDDTRRSRHPFLPSVLTRSPRSVSFSVVEEVHIYDEEEVDDEGIHLPKTPAIDWYSAKGSSQRPRHLGHQLLPLATTSSSQVRRPPLAVNLQPRRSALKKPESKARNNTPPPQFPGLYYPASPKVTYYSSKK